MSGNRLPKFAVTLVLMVSAAWIPGALPAATARARIPAVRATRSEKFVNHIGINAHLVNPLTPYRNWPLTLKNLEKLGVRHIRTEFAIDRPDLDAHLRQLAANGIRTDLVVSPTAGTRDLAARIDEIAALPRGVVEAVEPPNEWNYKGPKSDWESQDRTYVKALYSLVRSTPRLNRVKVLGPSLALRTGYSDLGNLSSRLDYGNIHLYPGGDRPTKRMDAQIADEELVAGSKPDYVTETGYHNALRCGCLHRPITESAAAVYEPRLFLDYFQRTQVLRVYQYELYDKYNPGLTGFNAHFGLMRWNFTPKPAYYALRNLIALASDPGRRFKPGKLAFSVDSGRTRVQQVLLEKRDGSFTLFLWRDVKIWDETDLTPITVAPIRATVRFGQPIRSTAVYQPTSSSNPIATQTAPQSVTVSLAGQVDAIRIFPAS